MKPFLYELAESLYKKHHRLEELTVVFPNRRAILYFRKHLSAILDKPVFSPRLLTIEDFIADLSELKIPDKLELIHRLYRSYNEVVKKTAPFVQEGVEPFDKFYFWGDMLLRDFDEADKYLIHAAQLFRDLSHQKELDSSFDYLTDEQRDFLISFWRSFEDELTENKIKFLDVWHQLYQLYSSFKQQLLDNGLAYEGMLHRIVAENIETLTKGNAGKRPIAFAGFNALTRAEEKIVCHFIEEGLADVYWDLDEYYVNNSTQEAGKFFREYQQHGILGKTFSKHIPSNFSPAWYDNIDSSPGTATANAGMNKTIRIFGAAEPVAQAKLMVQILGEKLAEGYDPEDTLIVLPDEKLLLPVLHGISGAIDKLNITMGFPISGTPLFNLVELLVEMQIAIKHGEFSHRQVLSLLSHPYIVAADAAVASAKRKEILNNNWVHIPSDYLASEVVLHRIIFSDVQTDILGYLREVLTCIGELEGLSDFDKEYAFHFLKLLNRMEEVIGNEHPNHKEASKVRRKEPSVDDESVVKVRQSFLKSFLRLFRQLIQTNRIPFTGEPLKGLQVMGVLETRNLDYKNVFVLSMNEGAFPSSGNKGSYIPFNIRRAYGLPTLEHQDTMYAYLFYRMIQRSENIFLFYNSETDVLGQGEISRYLQQLIFESGLEMEKRILHNPIQPRPVHPIVVKKDEVLLQKLAKLSEGNSKFSGISPSALNTYVECRLRFYLRHVARIKEPEEVEEDLDARILGNFFHEVMELFYKHIGEGKGSKLVEESDFAGAESVIDKLIDKVFIKAYRLDPGKQVQYEGQRLVVREVVRRFAHRIVEMDKMYAPFVMEAIEQEGLRCTLKLDHSPGSVILSGKIDRIDRKDNVLRVIDYKTGRDQLEFESIASLFSREGKRNKAAFQTVLYALLYKANAPDRNERIVPGLINRMNLFDKNFRFGLRIGKEYVDDVGPHLAEFELQLKLLLEELFDPAVSFDQTQVTETCKYCSYQAICYR